MKFFTLSKKCIPFNSRTSFVACHTRDSTRANFVYSSKSQTFISYLILPKTVISIAPEIYDAIKYVYIKKAQTELQSENSNQLRAVQIFTEFPFFSLARLCHAQVSYCSWHAVNVLFRNVLPPSQLFITFSSLRVDEKNRNYMTTCNIMAPPKL